MDVTKCPVCDQRFRVFGSENVMVHPLAIHADTTEARWVLAQLGVLVPASSGDTDRKSEPVPTSIEGLPPRARPSTTLSTLAWWLRSHSGHVLLLSWLKVASERDES
jgi:hypothetical protein